MTPDLPRDTVVLVTGGAGYIGSHVILALADAGLVPIVIDDLSNGHRRAVPDGVPFYRGDIADTALVTRIIGAHGVTAVMHFAGSILVPESVARPIDYYRNNVAGTLALLQAVTACGVGRFVLSSSAAVYGVPATLPVAEDAALQPINPYGRSKLMAEMLLPDIAAAFPLDYAILRYFNVAGADPAGRAGPSRQQPSHLIEVAMEAVVGRRAGVVVAGTDYPTPDGSCIRDYVHVSDLAAAHVAALKALIARPGRPHLYNIGYGRGFSVLQVLDAVDRVLGRRLGRSIGPRRAGDPPSLVGNGDRACHDLGWRPRHDDLDTIIGHAIAWARRDQGLQARGDVG